MDKASNLQRAFWSFLGYMLVGPFFGGLAVAIVLGLAGPLGLGALLPVGLPPAGVAIVSAFLWSVAPATVAAIIVAVLILLRGQLGWIEAAVAGVLGFFLAAIVLHMPYQDLFAPLAFLGGLISLAVRYALIAGGVLEGKPD